MPGSPFYACSAMTVIESTHRQAPAFLPSSPLVFLHDVLTVTPVSMGPMYRQPQEMEILPNETHNKKLPPACLGKQSYDRLSCFHVYGGR